MGPENDRLHGLDHLRAIAIVLVLLFHYDHYYGVPQWLKVLSSFGWSGVDLFFVLSGYLISEKLFRDWDRCGRIDFRSFYWNRFLRIVPAYFAVIALYFTFPALQEGRGLQPLWKFITFTQNISVDMFRNTFSHAWSLCVEGHFYLLLPIVVSLLFSTNMVHRAIYFIAAVAVTGVLLRYAIWELSVSATYGQTRMLTAIKDVYYPTYTRLDGLLVGISIASIFRYHRSLKEKINQYDDLLIVLSAILLISAYFLFDGSIVSIKFASVATMLFGFPLISIAYGLLVAAAISPGGRLSKYRYRPTAFLASLAYCIYLTHKIINHVVHTQLKPLFNFDSYQVFLVCLLASICAGLALHLTIEKPFLVIRDSLRRRKSRTNS